MGVAQKVLRRERAASTDDEAMAVRRWMGEVMDACEETGLGRLVAERPVEESEE